MRTTRGSGSLPNAPTMPVRVMPAARYPARNAACSGWNRTTVRLGSDVPVDPPSSAKCRLGSARAADRVVGPASLPVVTISEHRCSTNRSMALAMPVRLWATSTEPVVSSSRWDLRMARGSGTLTRAPSGPGVPRTTQTWVARPIREGWNAVDSSPEPRVTSSATTTPATATAETAAARTRNGPERVRPGPSALSGRSVLDVDVLQGLGQLPEHALQLHELHEVAGDAELAAHVRGGPGELVLGQRGRRLVVLGDGRVRVLDLPEAQVHGSPLELEPVLGLAVRAVHDLLDLCGHVAGRGLHGV